MRFRAERVRQRMTAMGLPALIVSRPENIFYLSGFSGSAGLLILTADQQWLISDFRYRLQAAEESPDWAFILAEKTLIATVRDLLQDLRCSPIGFDPHHVTITLFEQLGGLNPETPYTLLAAPDLIERIRMVKEPAELDLIREAARLTDGACQHVIDMAAPGITERELAMEAEWYMKRHGADGPSFDIIVATGDHSALPHAQPGQRPLGNGDLVVLDMGARFGRYCADLTRTIAIGTPPPIAYEIYEICLRAQLTGLAQIRAGMSGIEADALVRDVIVQAGYGDYFGHGTGHAVGLDIHESPRLNTQYQEPLPEGAVVTIEPGIYLPNVGGVRIEDLVLLTADGVERLSQAPKPPSLPIYG